MRPILSKVKSPQAVRRLMTQARRGKGKKKLVFTNGCFDILHKGHVTYLQQARKLGDFLVVALNDDASVRRLKGQDRPINPLADRLEVIAALEAVDWVTWFEEDTPLEALKVIRPDVLVKGGDWKPEQLAGYHEVRAWGGQVKILTYVEGRSTTRIIERAKKSR